MRHRARKFIIMLLFSMISILTIEIIVPSTKLILMSHAVTPPTPQLIIGLYSTDPQSIVEDTGTVTRFFISSRNTPLYKSAQKDFTAVMDFFNHSTRIRKRKSVIPLEIIENNSDMLLPEKINYEIKPVRTEKENNATHYYFEQVINRAPVMGSSVVVHMTKGSDVQTISGTLLHDEQIIPITYSMAQVLQSALTLARQSSNSMQINIHDQNESLVSPALLGISDDVRVHPSVTFTLMSTEDPPAYAERLTISRATGELLYREPVAPDLLDRQVFDCGNGNSSCPKARAEGNATYVKNNSTTNDVNRAYDAFGATYQFYKTQFNRDSFDGQGAVLYGAAYFSQPSFCPNAAFWAGSITGLPDKLFLLCDGMVASDIIAHEFTHGVTNSTARLPYTNQGGSLNEAVSDIFAFGVQQDWLLGEQSVIGVSRRADNPTLLRQPDRLFSPLYDCSSNDNGGVHKNATVIDHAFYLMSQGGTFNGCTFAGVGLTTAHAIWYRALTLYLTTSSNYRDAYNAVMTACHDLYPDTVCTNVDTALRTTEIDQQTMSRQTAPKCLNSSAQPAPVQCTRVTPSPTLTATLSPVFTLTPTRIFTTTPPVTLTPTRTITPTRPFSPTPTLTVTPTRSPNLTLTTTVTPTRSPSLTITLSPTLNPTASFTPSPTVPVVTPSPTPTLLFTPLPTIPMETPPPSLSCSSKKSGNADCQTDNAGKDVSLLDYLIWAQEYLAGCREDAQNLCGTDVDHDGSAMDADFDYPGSGHTQIDSIPQVSLLDYVIWWQNK